jgi:protein-S-isoprenylcysteine O-methyltransferase Ste14
MWSGFGVLSSNWIVSALFPIMFIVTYLYRASVEERMLLEALGEECVQYRSKTWKLIPFVY